MGMDNVNQKIIDTQRVINYINFFFGQCQGRGHYPELRCR